MGGAEGFGVFGGGFEVNGTQCRRTLKHTLRGFGGSDGGRAKGADWLWAGDKKEPTAEPWALGGVG